MMQHQSEEVSETVGLATLEVQGSQLTHLVRHVDLEAAHPREPAENLIRRHAVALNVRYRRRLGKQARQVILRDNRRPARQLNQQSEGESGPHGVTSPN